jgi:hypothetical protein
VVELAVEGVLAIVVAVTSAAEEDLLDLLGEDYVSGAVETFRLPCCSASEGAPGVDERTKGSGQLGEGKLGCG